MKKNYLKDMRDGKPLGTAALLFMTVKLSIPTMLAQLSIIIMEYIDAAMVGRLGGNATASIGLVSSSTWLMGGICYSAIIGFSVQASQLIGAKDESGARRIMKQCFIVTLGISAGIALIGAAISGFLPTWLGGGEEIRQNASKYFLIIALSQPIYQLNSIAVAMLQSSGNTRTPGILEAVMCLLDVPFNYLFIFVFKMGVEGAALGTLVAELVMTVPFLYFLLVKSPVFRFKRGEGVEIRKTEIKRAVKISAPIAFEQVIMTSAQVASTRIVSPLGSVSLAAHSLAITAESLCYMPGYGISSAATTMIGQSIGAKRKDLTAKLGYISVLLGMVLMGITGVLMYAFAPLMMNMLTPVAEIAALGTLILRIEAFAEPMFGASIVSTGVFRGAGDTLPPSVMNLVCMWLIRIPLAAFLSTKMGLRGVWLAMCIELCIRGAVFLIRLFIKNRKTA